MVDVVAVPDRLEQPVGEPQREDVERGLLAEVVVDPEDLVLVEDPVDDLVQLPGGLEIGAERLLEHHLRPVGEPGLVDHLHDGGCGRRGHAQVVEEPRVTAEPLRRALGGGREPLRAGGLRNVRQPVDERLDRLGLDPTVAKPLARLARELRK